MEPQFPEITESIDNVLRELLQPVAEIAALRHKEYLSTGEVEKLFGINAESLTSQRSRRTGPPYVKQGSRVLYRRQAVADYLEAHRVRTID